MSPETPFRIILASLFVLGIASRLFFQLRAVRSATGPEPRDPPRVYAFLALLSLINLVLMVSFIIDPALVVRGSLALPLGVRWAGAVLGILLLPLMFWTHASLGKNMTRSVQPRESAKLQTAGPYRFIRHPIYSLASGMWLGVAIMMANWWVLALLLVAVPALIQRINREEKNLIDKFGDEYRAYMRRTGRLVPFLHGQA